MATQARKSVPRRASNTTRSSTRNASWSRGQRLKEVRRQAQDDAHAANLALVKAGQPTPWQEACAARLAMRAEMRSIAAAAAQVAGGGQS